MRNNYQKRFPQTIDNYCPLNLQARVWNLLNKSKMFEKMVQHPKIVEIIEPILGDDFQLGSVATNTLFPGEFPTEKGLYLV